MSLRAILPTACIALLLGCVSGEQKRLSAFIMGAVLIVMVLLEMPPGELPVRCLVSLRHLETNNGRIPSHEYVRTVILNGGAAMGLSPLMPSNQDLIGHPKLLEQLVDHVLKLSTNSKG